MSAPSLVNSGGMLPPFLKAGLVSSKTITAKLKKSKHCYKREFARLIVWKRAKPIRYLVYGLVAGSFESRAHFSSIWSLIVLSVSLSSPVLAIVLGPLSGLERGKAVVPSNLLDEIIPLLKLLTSTLPFSPVLQPNIKIVFASVVGDVIPLFGEVVVP